jgi:hypothetical protein
MPVVNNLDLCWEEKAQREAAFQARALLENLTTVLAQTHDRLTEIKDSGKFDTLPAELKAAIAAWWTIFKGARKAIDENADIQAVYDWRPPA